MKRRHFLRRAAGASALAATGLAATDSLAHVVQLQAPYQPAPKYGPNDKIRIGLIGAGIIGHYDTQAALRTPGTELAAICDLYDGRLAQAKAKFGKDLFTTRDYREVLARPDVDMVIVATPDHWHAPITIAALNSGKHVYCEKPMVHQAKEGLAIIEAERKSGKRVQVGSQRVSSLAFIEAKKLYEAGAIGKLNMIVASTNRHSSLGAWQYSIPPDASPQTVDFDRFLGNAPKVAFDPVRFFRWRNYREYGTGVPGDLFVHLITGIHFITGALGPTRIVSSGQLSYWKDGRNVPDVVSSILEYPETDKHPAFQVSLQVNFADGSGGGEATRIIGSEGAITLGWNDFTLSQSPLPKAPGYGGYDSLFTFTPEQQAEFERQYKAKYSEADRARPQKKDTKFQPPPGHDDRVDHFANLFRSIREGTPVVQDATFGLRAAGPCLATNQSAFQKKIIRWDPVKMKMS
jgi:predicted dehydrogenase